VKTAGIYTVFLENSITYGGNTWNERVSYDITITNPCSSTTLFTTNTTIADIEYIVGEATATHSFTGVSDTITNGITTSGNCGGFTYTLASNDTQIGTPYI
jgi:hypothetical protein